MKPVVAFFDVDETLIKMKSMFHFYKYWCEIRSAHQEYTQFNDIFIAALQQGVSREELNKMYYKQFKGTKVTALNTAGGEWFSRFCLDSNIYIDKVVIELNKHQSDGHQTVFVSGSMLPLLSPLAEHLKVDEVLCTALLHEDNGILTGEIGTPQAIGEGKREAVLAYLSCLGISPMNCFSYGDDLSDIPMLSATGNPVCVGGTTALAKYARDHHWGIIS